MKLIPFRFFDKELRFNLSLYTHKHEKYCHHAKYCIAMGFISKHFKTTNIVI